MHTPALEQALQSLKAEIDRDKMHRQMDMDTDNRRARTHHQDGEDRSHKRKWGNEGEGDYKRRRDADYSLERSREDSYRGRESRTSSRSGGERDRHRSLSPGGKKLFGDPSPSLWVGNYNRTSKERFPLGEDELRREFGKYGDIYSIKAYPPKNCAFVNFWDTEAATRAAEALTGTRINDIKILVNFGKAPSELLEAIQGGKPDSKQDRERSDRDKDRSERSDSTRDKRTEESERDEREKDRRDEDKDFRKREEKLPSPDHRFEEREVEHQEDKKQVRSLSRSPPRSSSSPKVRTPEESRSPLDEEEYDEAFDFEITRQFIEKKLLRKVNTVGVDLIGRVVRVMDLVRKDKFVLARIAAVNPKEDTISLEQYPKDPRRLKPEKLSSLAADPQPTEAEIKRWVRMQKKFAIVLDSSSLLHNLKKVKAVVEAHNPYIIFTVPHSVHLDLKDAASSPDSDKANKADAALKLLSPHNSKKVFYLHPPSSTPFGFDSVEELKGLVPKERFADIFITTTTEEAKKLSSTLKVITFEKIEGASNIFFWDYIMEKLLKY